MLRLFGIGLITIVVSVWGEKIISRQKKRLKSLEAIIRLEEAFASKARSFGIPLKSFLSEYRDELLENTGFLSRAVLSMSLGAAARESADGLCLDNEDVELIREFGDELGQYSLDEELKRCSYYISQTQRILNLAKEKLPGEIKLLRSAGVMCGILAAVLLI